MNKKLKIELVPECLWYLNLRSILSKELWDYYRKKCYKSSDYVCEICGGIGDKHPVECHEIWEYDDTNHVQKLAGFIALCPNCHMVKHIGRGELNKAIAHFSEINKSSNKEAYDCLENAREKWSERNKFKWSQDLSFLQNKKQFKIKIGG